MDANFGKKMGPADTRSPIRPFGGVRPANRLGAADQQAIQFRMVFYGWNETSLHNVSAKGIKDRDPS